MKNNQTKNKEYCLKCGYPRTKNSIEIGATEQMEKCPDCGTYYTKVEEQASNKEEKPLLSAKGRGSEVVEVYDDMVRINGLGNWRVIPIDDIASVEFKNPGSINPGTFHITLWGENPPKLTGNDTYSGLTLDQSAVFGGRGIRVDENKVSEFKKIKDLIDKIKQRNKIDFNDTLSELQKESQAWDRKKIRNLVAQFNKNINIAMKEGRNVHQASLDLTDKVDKLISNLPENQQERFWNIYSEEMEALTQDMEDRSQAKVTADLQKVTDTAKAGAGISGAISLIFMGIAAFFMLRTCTY